MYLSNKEIVEQWHEFDLPFIIETYEKDGVIDKPARRESFNNFTDMLCRDGQISDDQYNEICLPDIYEEEFRPDFGRVKYYIED